jgi:hypothetical protein
MIITIAQGAKDAAWDRNFKYFLCTGILRIKSLVNKSFVMSAKADIRQLFEKPGFSLYEDDRCSDEKDVFCDL